MRSTKYFMEVRVIISRDCNLGQLTVGQVKLRTRLELRSRQIKIKFNKHMFFRRFTIIPTKSSILQKSLDINRA